MSNLNAKWSDLILLHQNFTDFANFSGLKTNFSIQNTYQFSCVIHFLKILSPLDQSIQKAMRKAKPVGRYLH